MFENSRRHPGQPHLYYDREWSEYKIIVTNACGFSQLYMPVFPQYLTI